MEDTSEQKVDSRNLREQLIELKNAVLASPDNPDLRYQLGQLALTLGDAATATKELERAIRLGRADYQTRLTLGQAWLAAGDYERIFSARELESPQSPEDNAGLLTLQGKARLAQGRPKRAVEQFQAALDALPGYPPALTGMVEYHLKSTTARTC